MVGSDVGEKMVVAVFGAKGRVGERVCQLAKQRGYAVLEIDVKNKTRDNCADNLCVEEKVDVTIDFSVAAATREVCEFCKAHRCILVTGTTGRSAEEMQCLEELKKHVRVCEKANFSKGFELTEKICKILAPLNWDCDVVETHRKGKADRPSGTAKQLYQALLMGGTRTVCVHSLRNGSNFGRHEIVFGTNGESITIVHQAENVDIFARGALDEAEKLVAETKREI